MDLHFTCDEPRPQDDAFAARIDLMRAQAAMMRLPEAFREVLVLCGLEELSSEDAATVLEISPVAIRKRLSRARAQLAAMLGKNTDQEEKSP